MDGRKCEKWTKGVTNTRLRDQIDDDDDYFKVSKKPQSLNDQVFFSTHQQDVVCFSSYNNSCYSFSIKRFLLFNIV